MDHVTLHNGVKMPQLGYGVYQVSKDECERCVLDALKVGYRRARDISVRRCDRTIRHYHFGFFDLVVDGASRNTSHFDTSMSFVRECAAKEGSPTVHDGLFARATNTSVIDAYLTANGFMG